MAVHMAGCCTPLPGDRIVGLVTEGKGVTVHTIDCEVLVSFSGTPERWLDVTWDANLDTAEMHVGRITTVLNNAPGSLNSLTEGAPAKRSWQTTCSSSKPARSAKHSCSCPRIGSSLLRACSKIIL